MKKWLVTPGVILLYWRSQQPKHKPKAQRVFVFGAVLPGSKVLFARISPGIGLQVNIRNIIPDEADIVRACKAGDVLTVRSLLVSGKARPNDLTESNQTIMMVSAFSNFGRREI